MASEKVLDWLLEEDNPSIRYRVLTELLAVPPDDPRALLTRKKIPDSEAVRHIFSCMHPDGYWLQTNPRTGETLGNGVLYGAFATTHFCLAYLAELGLDRGDPRIARASERYLSLQQPDGDFYRHFSCLYAYNIRTFLMLGYGDDPRVHKTIALMLGTKRRDGGYLCGMHEDRRKNAKSCIRGSAKALLAFSMLPELWESERCQELVHYFLSREGIFRLSDPAITVNFDVEHTIFPIIWRSGLLEILLALSRMGYGWCRELDRAWALLETKKNGDGEYILDWTPVQSLLKAGKRGQPNKWVTFYALLALKYRELD